MGSGAWPFLVGGLICLVYSDNERDLSLLNSIVNRLTGEARAASGLRSGCFFSGSLMSSRALLRGTTCGKQAEAKAITGL